MSEKKWTNIEGWHTISAEDSVDILESDIEAGLSAKDVELRRELFGPNQLASPPGKPWWKEIIEELTEPMILLLIFIGIVYGFIGELKDAITIIVIIIAVLAVEMINESRAKRAIKSLSSFTSIFAPVIRDGRYQDISHSDLVPGDLVILRSGERIPADLRLLVTQHLQMDESSLTGESSAIVKDAKIKLDENTDLGDRRNLAYSGTWVKSGKGLGIVIRTGMATELGKIAGFVQMQREPRTPLQLHMKELTRWMVWIALGFSTLVALVGWIQGAGWKQTILTGLTLSFATIPEELPILIIMVLGIGAFRLSKQKAIVRRLRTAESLGNITVVATDKTGTLTENRMRVDQWVIQGKRYTSQEWRANKWSELALFVGCLANDSLISDKNNAEISFEGDPTDTAFLYAAEDKGYDVTTLRKQYRIVEQFPFHDAARLVTVSVIHENSQFIMSKGAPEELLDRCESIVWIDELVSLSSEYYQQITKQSEVLAEEGYRVIGIAFKQTPMSTLLASREQAEASLVFLGLAALYDPPRQDVASSVQTLQEAGVRVMMVTGDHAGTARSIASQININSSEVLLGRDIEVLSDKELQERLDEVSICARTTAEHKLRIVRALQQRGEVVAVTGDGVNDGPALKEAAIGIAMGKSGTDVAKESADIVLADDHFATVTVAVKEGRKLFANLYKAVRYYLTAKIALILSTLCAVIAGYSLPFTPIQIIIMELFLDLGAATSFSVEKQESDVMKRGPRSQSERFMNKAMITSMFSGGVSLAFAVLVAYFWSLLDGAPTEKAQSMAFSSWMIGHLVLALMMRSEREPLIKLGLFSNRFIMLWVSSAVVFLILAIYVPSLSMLLHLTPLGMSDWLIVLICAVLAPLWIEIGKWIRWQGRFQGNGK
ncbi:cation-transporting P-type ATPase [Paenibacillus donghaensis]|uniref:cation-translocating P-type ATPase n=1 Tax=Paenibacillus donghaensis TaxID=414771 RepID=UPI0018845741|nr:cation-transporting P-type ATPase [Paenibacillus donghaensis]MBE9915922.1 cation-transporting P-type ATPase [Paenibacillus donghaensis]